MYGVKDLDQLRAQFCGDDDLLVVAEDSVFVVIESRRAQYVLSKDFSLSQSFCSTQSLTSRSVGSLTGKS